MSITFDVDFQNSDDLWTSTAETTHPTNGGVCRRIVNSITTSEKVDGPADANSAAYRTPTTGALLLSNIDYDGSDDHHVGNTAVSSSITASAFDILVAFDADDTSSNNSIVYDNPALVCDASVYFGVIIKNGGVHAYNWDGNADSVSIAISTGTAYVVRMRHDSGTLYLSVNGGSESSVTSGDTQVVTGALRLGLGGGSTLFNGKIGRVVIANTGDELSSLYSTMVTDWVTGAGGGPKGVFGLALHGPLRRAVY